MCGSERRRAAQRGRGRVRLVVDRQACKPSSVSRRSGTAIIYLGRPLPDASSSQPEDGPGAHSPPIRPCSGWGLPCPRCCHRGGELLPRRFALTRKRGGMFSVALSVGFPRLAVSQHPARWSSDFPPRQSRSDRPAYLSTLTSLAPKAAAGQSRELRGASDGRIPPFVLSLPKHGQGRRHAPIASPFPRREILHNYCSPTFRCRSERSEESKAVYWIQRSFASICFGFFTSLRGV